MRDEQTNRPTELCAYTRYTVGNTRNTRSWLSTVAASYTVARAPDVDNIVITTTLWRYYWCYKTHHDATTGCSVYDLARACLRLWQTVAGSTIGAGQGKCRPAEYRDSNQSSTDWNESKQESSVCESTKLAGSTNSEARLLLVADFRSCLVSTPGICAHRVGPRRIVLAKSPFWACRFFRFPRSEENTSSPCRFDVDNTSSCCLEIHVTYRVAESHSAQRLRCLYVMSMYQLDCRFAVRWGGKVRIHHHNIACILRFW